jgi:hypothetical protein
MATTREARDRYLAENGFTTASYTDRWVVVKAWKLPIYIFNTKARQQAIPLHDLHHIATGYGTDWVGEAEIGAWELRAGCRTAITYFLNGGTALIGLFIAPRRTVRAWKRAKGQKTLYALGKTAEDVLGTSVEELRGMMGMPVGGQADVPARLHAGAPGRT